MAAIPAIRRFPISLSLSALSSDVPNRPSALFFSLFGSTRQSSRNWPQGPSLAPFLQPIVRRCSLIIYNSHSTTSTGTKLPKGSPRGLPAIAERPTTTAAAAMTVPVAPPRADPLSTSKSCAVGGISELEKNSPSRGGCRKNRSSFPRPPEFGRTI